MTTEPPSITRLPDLTVQSVRSFFDRSEYTAAEWSYLGHQAQRISFLINLVTSLLAKMGQRPDKSLQILDIGPHFLTHALRRHLGPEFILNTLGWSDDRLKPGEGIVHNHVNLDLNDAFDSTKWPLGEVHQVIVLAEVVEHLHTSPRFVLEMVRSLLDPSGYLIVQTPNAVALRNRMVMLGGKSPFQTIVEHGCPGHFRELTGPELVDYCEAAGLRCEQLIYADYWPERGIYRMLEKLWPSFRKGLTAVCSMADVDR